MRHLPLFIAVCMSVQESMADLQILIENTCDDIVEDWCSVKVTCTDGVTGDQVYFTRVLHSDSKDPVDTSKVHDLRKICNDFGLELPSIHNDLENWCVFQTGLYGTKGRVPLGLGISSSEPKGWSWLDRTPTDYDRFEWGSR